MIIHSAKKVAKSIIHLAHPGKLVSFLLFILFTTIVQSAHAQSHSLQYYVNHAINSSPKISQQRNRIDSVRLQKKIINANLDLPTISASADYLYAPFLGPHFGYAEPVTNGGNYAARLNISYPLFTHKRKKVRYHATSIVQQQARYHIQKLKHALRDTVTHQYIIVYNDMKKLQYLAHIGQLLKQQKKVVRSLARQGITKITDVKQIRIQYQSNRIAQKQAQKIYRQDLSKLNTQSGLSHTAANIKLQMPTIPVDTSSTVQPSRFMDQFKFDSLKTTAKKQVYNLKYQPSVSAMGNTGLLANNFTGIENNFGYEVGVHISVPIYDGNKRKIVRQQTQLQQNTIDTFQQRFRKKRKSHLNNLRKQLRQTDQQLQMIQKQIAQYKDLLKNYRSELKQGLVSTVNYLIVLRQYTNARQQQVQTRGEKLMLENKYNYWNW